MKKISKILTSILLAVMMAFSMATLSGCDVINGLIDSIFGGKTHTCESTCEVCGGCLDVECLEEVCAQKCQGHGDDSSVEEHECESVCDKCGKCTDDSCIDEVCAEKCQGHQTVIPVKYTKRFDFDAVAGNAHITGIMSDGYNGGISVTSQEGVGSWITNFTWANEAVCTINVWADQEAEADLVIKVRKMESVFRLTSRVSVAIDGYALDSEAEVPASQLGAKAEFAEVNLGQFTFLEGLNIITITPQATMENFDFAAVTLFSGKDTNFTWKELHDEVGKTYYGIHENVTHNEAYRKNEQENCLGIANNDVAGEINFPIYAEKTGLAKISITACTMTGIFFSQRYTMTINGTAVSSNAQMPTGSPWTQYETVELGEFYLTAGLNNITIKMNGVMDYSYNHNIRSITIEADFATSWNALTEIEHTCESVCDVCGGCLNKACPDDACATKCNCECVHVCGVCGNCVDVDSTGVGCVTKCECVTTEFSALDEKAAVIGGIVKDGDAGYVKIVDNNAFNVIVFSVTADKAGKATLAFNVGGNPQADWTFADYFRVWINDTGARTADSSYVGNKLDKNVYTAKTVLGAYDQFGYVVLGEVELAAGENEIALGYTAVGTDWAHFHVKGMSLKTNLTLTWENANTAHVCESQCPVCYKCLDAECEEFACSEKCPTHVDDGTASTKTFYSTNENVLFNEAYKVYIDAETGENNLRVATNDVVGYVTFPIKADGAGRAKISLWMQEMPHAALFTDRYTLTINGVEQSSSAMLPAPAQWGPNQEVYLGEFSLQAGENTITISMKDVRDYTWNHNIGELVIKSNVAVDWDAETVVHSCQNVCPTCYKCMNADCAETVCAAKCEGHVDDATATSYTFDSINENVTFNEAYKVNADGGCLGILSGEVVGVVTFPIKAEKAGKVKVYIWMQQMPNDIAFTDRFTLTINGVEQTSSARLPSDALWGPLTEVYLGEFSLQAGENTLTITMKGTRDYTQNYDMGKIVMKANMELDWYVAPATSEE